MVKDTTSADRYPVSIKGVLLLEQAVLLVKNDRAEWELPGGRIEPGELPAQTLVREFEEELALSVTAKAAIDSYLFEVIPGRNVFIVTYGCQLAGEYHPRLSEEHSEYRLFPLADLANIRLPPGYRRSIEQWHSRS